MINDNKDDGIWWNKNPNKQLKLYNLCMAANQVSTDTIWPVDTSSPKVSAARRSTYLAADWMRLHSSMPASLYRKHSMPRAMTNHAKTTTKLDNWNTTPHQLAGCTRRSSGLDSNALSSRCQTASQTSKQQIWAKVLWPKSGIRLEGLLEYSYAAMLAMRVFPRIGVGTPKSYILIGFSIINHPFWGTHFWKQPCTQGGNST